MGYNEYNYQVYLETKQNYTLENIRSVLNRFTVNEENASTLVLDFDGWKLWIHFASDSDVEMEAAEMADYHKLPDLKECNARLEIYAEDDPDEKHYHDHLYVIDAIATLKGVYIIDQFLGALIRERGTATFKDINFKISVMGALHDHGFYRDEAEALSDEFGDERDYSYQPIKEVYEYYQNLEIDLDKLAKIESLYPDGGDESYMFAMNNWDGEDDTFDISSIEGIEFLVNLKVFDPISMIANEGLDYRPLLHCQKLQLVNASYMKSTAENEEIIRILEERGVVIKGLEEVQEAGPEIDTSFLEFVEGNKNIKAYIDNVREYEHELRDWEVWHNLGYEYGNLPEPNKALELKCYDVSLLLNPSNHLAYFNLGKGFYQNKDYVKAREYYLKTIEIDPEFASVWESLAQVAGREGKQDEALEFLEKAIEVNPDDVNSNINMAYYMIKYGKAADAMEYAEKAFSHADIYTSSFNKGHIYLVLGEEDQAVQSYAISLRAATNEGADFWDDFDADFELLEQYGIPYDRGEALKVKIAERVKNLPPREWNEIADLFVKCAYSKEGFLNEEKVMILEGLEVPEVYINWLTIANRAYDTGHLPYDMWYKKLVLKNYDSLLEAIYDEYHSPLLSSGYVPFAGLGNRFGYVFDIRNKDVVLEINYDQYFDVYSSGKLDAENENVRELLAEKVLSDPKFDSFGEMLQWHIDTLKLGS